MITRTRELVRRLAVEWLRRRVQDRRLVNTAALGRGRHVTLIIRQLFSLQCDLFQEEGLAAVGLGHVLISGQAVVSTAFGSFVVLHQAR